MIIALRLRKFHEVGSTHLWTNSPRLLKATKTFL